MKKSNYITVLKECLQEADTTKTSDILGPMVEPILGYDGNGELKTHKSAADILKKYYFEGEGNEGESVISVNDPDTVTSGEKDQKKIDGVKKRVEDIITSTTQTDQPTEKTLKEMVVDLEDILFEESDDIDNDMASNLESLLEDDNDMASNLESLLEDDNDMASNLEYLLEDDLEEDNDMASNLESLLEDDDKATTAGAKRDQEEEVDPASKDVIIDKGTKTKLESILMSEDDEVEDEDDSENDEDDSENDEDDDTNPLDVDKKLKESESFSDKLSSMLNENLSDDNDYVIEGIEDIMNEQTMVAGDIVGIDSPFTDDDAANDVDVDNPMHSKVTTEDIEDSVLEWLIMEIEDTDLLEEDELVEFDDTNLDEDEDFKVSKISSKNIRV